MLLVRPVREMLHSRRPPRAGERRSRPRRMLMPSDTTSDLPYRVLGRTGERVSAIGLGGWHLSLPGVSPSLATRLVHSAIERGINFLDNCWDYNDGESERRMGVALQGGYRDRAFLMTKIDGRSKRGRHTAARRIAAATPYRSHRPRPASRGAAVRRRRPHLPGGRRAGSAGGGAHRRQAALHRIHRAQGPAHSPPHARGRAASTASPSTPRRCP